MTRREGAPGTTTESTLDFAPEDVRRVASVPRPSAEDSGLQEPRFTVPATPDDSSAFARQRGGVIIPNVPPGWDEESIRQSMRAAVAGAVPPPPPARRPNAVAVRRPRTGSAHDNRFGAPTGDPTASSQGANGAPGAGQRPADEAAAERPEFFDAEEAEQARLEQVRDTAQALNAQESTVLFSDVTPRDMKRSEPQVDPDSFDLVEDPTLASPTVTGRQLELRPPVSGLVFRINMQVTVMAQATLLEIPPDPLPDGLAPYAPMASLVITPPHARGHTVMTLHIDPAAVAKEHFDQLRIYTHDRIGGWKPLERQKRNAEEYHIGGMDNDVRTYAVLGPAEHRLKAPRF